MTNYAENIRIWDIVVVLPYEDFSKKCFSGNM